MVHATKFVSSTAIDAMVSRDDVFTKAANDLRHETEALAIEYLSDQVRRCETYANYARIKGANFSDPRSFPPVPTTAFKVANLRSIAEEEVAHWCLSSGTQGVQSRVPRDGTTIDRLLGGLRAGLALIRQWHEEEIQVIHLGPETSEAGEIWFPYVMSLTELLYPTAHLNTAGRFDWERGLSLLGEAMARGKHVGIIGAPFAVADFCAEIERRGRSLTTGDQVTVVTGGGWKLRAGEALPKPAFRKHVASAFGMNSDVHIRDAFNQVELNTVMLECEAHRLHVPPWVVAFARNPHDLAPLASGQVGLMSYVDVSAHSYPCIIVGDDLGVVEDGPCACGRPGPVMTITRRVDRGFQRGCALSLQAMAGSHA